MGTRLEGNMGRLSGIPAVIIANLVEMEREILNFDPGFEVSGHTTKVSSFCFSFTGAKMYRICLESRKISLV